MKILFLNHEFPPIGGGGGAWTLDISRFLKHRGHEIKVVTSHNKGLPRHELVEGVSVIRLPSLRIELFRASFLSMGFYIIGSFFYSLLLIIRWRPDIIQVVFAVPAGVVGLLLSKMTGIPYVISAHLGDVPGGVPEKTHKWFRWIFPATVPVWRNAARITAVSHHTGSLIQESYHLQSIIIPNGYDPKKIQPQAIQLNIPPIIVFAGRFVLQKNLSVLIEVLSSLEDLPWQCKLVGDGPLRKSIEQSLIEKGLTERFEITGWLTPDEVVDQLRCCDLLFMPSLSEGLSIAGVHALAVGLAIVAYDVGGFDELVKNDVNGFLAKPGEKQKLTEGLQTYLENPKKLLSARKASLAHAKRFDLNLIVDAYEQIYHEVLK